VVVVLGQVLGELETRELVVRRDASHQSSGFEIDAELRGRSGIRSAISAMLTGWPTLTRSSMIARRPWV
jgi:hypothetical protein